MEEKNSEQTSDGIGKESKINLDDFKKVHIVIGEIKLAERVLNTEKLIRLEVDFGEGESRQIISGIAEYFPDITVLVGKKCPFIANLKTKTIRGLESNGMILAVSSKDGEFSLLTLDHELPPGSRAR